MGTGTRVTTMKDCFATEQKCGKPGMKRNEKKKKKEDLRVFVPNTGFSSPPPKCVRVVVKGCLAAGLALALGLELKSRRK
jgi:hypothetical protein